MGSEVLVVGFGSMVRGENHQGLLAAALYDAADHLVEALVYAQLRRGVEGGFLLAGRS